MRLLSWAYHADMSRNSTSVLSPFAQDTYWGSFEEVSKYNVSLNYAERMWMAWYAYMQNDVLATGIMSFVMHETVYFGRSLPWIIIDMIPWFRRYKIQPVCTLYPPDTMQTLTCPRTKSPPHGNNGSVLSLSSFRTSPLSSRKSGSFTLCVNSSV